MAEIILHHYPESPFAEKIRLILGFKRLAYRSVLIPMMLPKPDVIALTGGYRRTPILQIGSDVYCDTALIAQVLEQIRPEPTLYPAMHAATAIVLAAWADQHWFAAGVGFAMQPEGFASMFQKYSPEHSDLIRQPELVDYLEKQLLAMNTDIQARPIVVKLLDGIHKIRTLVETENGPLPEETVRKVHDICKELVPLSSRRLD